MRCQLLIVLAAVTIAGCSGSPHNPQAWCRLALKNLNGNPGPDPMLPMAANATSPASPASAPQPGWLYLPVGDVAIPVWNQQRGRTAYFERLGEQSPGLVFRSGDKQVGFFVGGVPIPGGLAAAAKHGARLLLFGDFGDVGTPGTPDSRKFWASLVQRRHLFGVPLLQLMTEANARDVNCSRANDDDWATLYALALRGMFAAGRSRHAETSTTAVRSHKVYVWMQPETTDGKSSVHYLVSNGDTYFLDVLVRTAGGESVRPVERGAVDWKAQPAWLGEIASVVLSDKPAAWQTLVMDAEAAGMVRYKQPPSQ